MPTLPAFILSRLRRALVDGVAKRRPPDFVIGGQDDPYMRRWWVIPRNRWLNIYLHQVLRPDDDRALHDHPWASLSVLVEGGYYEVTPVLGSHKILKRVWHGPGALIWRGPRYAHRLELADGYAGVPRPSWSLFLTGPRVREWGFHCPNGWRHWRDFTAPANPGEIGKGCGE